MKIFIAVPSMDQVPVQFCQSLAMLQRPSDETVTIGFEVGSLVYTARNNLAIKAVQAEATHVFWLDSDMYFNPDTLLRMLKTMEETGADFLTGLYYRRVPPYSPVLFKDLEITDAGCEWHEFDELPNGLFEVAGCGFGCVLMKTDVLWDVIAHYGQPFSPIREVGEDLSFCWRARQEGYKVICDPSIPLGHIGHYIITEEMYSSYRKAVGDDGKCRSPE